MHNGIAKKNMTRSSGTSGAMKSSENEFHACVIFFYTILLYILDCSRFLPDLKQMKSGSSRGQAKRIQETSIAAQVSESSPFLKNDPQPVTNFGSRNIHRPTRIMNHQRTDHSAKLKITLVQSSYFDVQLFP